MPYVSTQSRLFYTAGPLRTPSDRIGRWREMPLSTPPKEQMKADIERWNAYAAMMNAKAVRRGLLTQEELEQRLREVRHG